MSDKFDLYRQLLSEGGTPEFTLFCNCNKKDIIIIGGTRQQTFSLPFSYELIKKILVVYTQNGVIVLKKKNEDFEVADFNDNLLYFTLSEEETFKFKEGPIELQMKVLLEDGSILVSDILHNYGVKTIDNSFFVDGEAPIYALQADVDIENIDLLEIFSIPAGSEQLYRIKFMFDSSWDIFSKTAIFKDEYNHLVKVTLNSDDTCDIPNEIIKSPGNIYVSVMGIYRSSVKKLSTWSNSVRVITSSVYTEEHDFDINDDSEEESVDPATPDKAGIMKLYDDRGYNTDGTVTQEKITEGFDSIHLSTNDNDNECLVINVDF